MSDRKKKTRVLLRRLVLAAAALVLGISVYRWNAQSMMGNRLPMPFGYGVATVLSGSMEPRLSIDDLVVIRQTDTVQPGDIVVYQDGGSLVIHRVMKVDGDTVQTKGDANNAPDAPITMDAVKGVLLWDVPGVGAAVRLFRQPVVIAALLAAMVILTERSYRKEKKKDTQELENIQQEIRQLLEEMKEETK